MAQQRWNHELPRRWEIARCLLSVERRCPREWLRKSSSIKTEMKYRKKTKMAKSPNRQKI
jgi:hypothetical protein